MQVIMRIQVETWNDETQEWRQTVHPLLMNEFIMIGEHHVTTWTDLEIWKIGASVQANTPTRIKIIEVNISD